MQTAFQLHVPLVPAMIFISTPVNITRPESLLWLHLNLSVVGAVQAHKKKEFPQPEIASTHERTAGKCNNQMRGFKVEMRLLCSTY